MTDSAILIAFANPVEGKDEEFRSWYWDTHVQEVLALPGFLSAEPYRLEDEPSPVAPFRYATIYTVEGSAVDARNAMFGGGLGSSEFMDTSAVLVAPLLPRSAVAR